MNGYMDEMKPKVGNINSTLNLNGMDWSVVACLFVDDNVFLTKSEKTNTSGIDGSIG